MTKEKDEILRIWQWFEQAVPSKDGKYEIEKISVQIGCHIEEFLEMLEALGHDKESKVYQDLHELSMKYKTKEESVIKTLSEAIKHKKNKVEILDSLADQVVTSTGIAKFLKLNMMKAIKEVNDSNYSKFENGKAVFDQNGKIKKGKDYFKPNLEPFVE